MAVASDVKNLSSQMVRARTYHESNILNNFINTANKIAGFIKENFLSLAAISSIIITGFLCACPIPIGIGASFAVLKAGFKISTCIFKPIEKIDTAPFAKRYVADVHDAKKWLGLFKKAGFEQRKRMLKEIGLQTLISVRKLGVKNTLDLALSDLDNMKKNTQIIGRNIKTKKDEEAYFKNAAGKNTKTAQAALRKVEVIEGDSLDVALHLKNKNGYKEACVLNMANAVSPGGGFLDGCAAQEESLCRRSALFDSININESQMGNANLSLKRKMGSNYNIPRLGALYSPSVKVFRGNVNEGFAYYSAPGEVNVISSAAPDLRRGEKPPDYRQMTKIKLQMILNTALENNQELVVLGAYGCGAFSNDPKEIAGIVKEILSERPLYQQKMKIVFAIISDKNDTKGNIKGFLPLRDFVR